MSGPDALLLLHAPCTPPHCPPAPPAPLLPPSLLLLPLPFLLFLITWTTFLLLYVMLMHPVARCTVHPSCTPTTLDRLLPPCTPHTSSGDPSGSPVEAPGSTQLCVGLTWHLPHDPIHMYIKTAEVGTEEAAFFSPFPLQPSEQGHLAELG